MKPNEQFVGRKRFKKAQCATLKMRVTTTQQQSSNTLTQTRCKIRQIYTHMWLTCAGGRDRCGCAGRRNLTVSGCVTRHDLSRRVNDVKASGAVMIARRLLEFTFCGAASGPNALRACGLRAYWQVAQRRSRMSHSQQWRGYSSRNRLHKIAVHAATSLTNSRNHTNKCRGNHNLSSPGHAASCARADRDVVPRTSPEHAPYTTKGLGSRPRTRPATFARTL